MSTQAKTKQADGGAGEERTDTLSVTDNRTGLSYELPIVDGAIRSLDVRQIKTSDEDFGLLAYDPAFMNTALVPQRDHLPRWRHRCARVPRLPDRAAR